MKMDVRQSLTGAKTGVYGSWSEKRKPGNTNTPYKEKKGLEGWGLGWHWLYRETEKV